MLTFIDIVHLRDFKRHIPTLHGVPTQRYAHFYLEYAPYGTLSQLITKYPAFNRYVLELFVWHVFNSLARAIVELEDSALRDSVPNVEAYILHLDIKTDSIFLGYEHSRGVQSADLHNRVQTGDLDDLETYPTIKLRDFGEAMLHEGEQNKPQWRHFYNRGQQAYRPPVSSNELCNASGFLS